MLSKDNAENETGIHQKRTLVFINHFIMKTIEFINNFAVQCEDKLLNFETKIQKVEASLIILETKLSSIPALKEFEAKTVPVLDSVETTKKVEDPRPIDAPDAVAANIPEVKEPISEEKEPEAPKIDPAYEKYHKMIQFGVPLQAVKLKIIQDGLDPNMMN